MYRNKGATLIEVMVLFVIAMIILLLIVSKLETHQRPHTKKVTTVHKKVKEVKVHVYSTGSQDDNDLLWWYVFYTSGLNNTPVVDYCTSKSPVTDLSKATFARSTSLPTQLKDISEEEVEEIQEKDLPEEIANEEPTEETTQEVTEEVTSESPAEGSESSDIGESSSDASSSGDAGGCDGGGDGGGGGD